jgi:protein gp37
MAKEIGEMMLRQSKGNMFEWVSHTWNPIKGICLHDCEYCYMKIFPQKPIRLDEREFNDDLGYGNTIFVGSSTDMFAKDVPDVWIERVLGRCKLSDKNTYLFQTKNPKRYSDFDGSYPPNSIFGTTIETNRETNLAKAPTRAERAKYIRDRGKCIVTIEPIMDFDLEPFVAMIKDIQPNWVNIGADSKNHNLPEPSKEKVDMLITGLKKFTEIKQKRNLNRLVK